MATETEVLIDIELISGAPQSTVEGDPNVFYFDITTIPAGKEGWWNATTWYYYDMAQGYKIGVGPRPKPKPRD